MFKEASHNPGTSSPELILANPFRQHVFVRKCFTYPSYNIARPESIFRLRCTSFRIHITPPREQLFGHYPPMIHFDRSCLISGHELGSAWWRTFLQYRMSLHDFCNRVQFPISQCGHYSRTSSFFVLLTRSQCKLTQIRVTAKKSSQRFFYFNFGLYALNTLVSYSRRHDP